MKKILACLLAIAMLLSLGACGNFGGIGGKTGSAACLMCADKGLDNCEGHECLLCEGRGTHECYSCGGMSSGYCYFCDNGQVDCSCDGGLVYYNTPYTGESGGETGGETGGTGTGGGSSCGNCEKGYVECSLCKGSGRFGSYSVGGFDGADSVEVEELCMSCRGLGKISCSVCGGDGVR